MKIYLLKALGGDCFVIDFENKHCILIDGGFKDTYENYLKQLLSFLHNSGSQLDYVILTHYDQDHIQGLIPFITENGKEQGIIKVGDIIVNGYSAFRHDKAESEADELRAVDLHQSLHDASKTEHSEFETHCLTNGYSVNEFNKGKSVVENCIAEGEGYTIRFVSPNANQLKEYCKEITDYLKKRDYIVNGINIQNLVMNLQTQTENDDGELKPASGQGESDLSQWKSESYPKTLTMPNRASLAFEILHNDKTLLFCGDADMKTHVKLLNKKYDLIKLSHHGTVRGNECFFGSDPIKAKHYIISTDGQNERNKHPNKALLAKIITQNSGLDTIHLHFNYDICNEVIGRDYSLLADHGQQEKYNYELHLSQNAIIL